MRIKSLDQINENMDIGQLDTLLTPQLVSLEKSKI